MPFWHALYNTNDMQHDLWHLIQQKVTPGQIFHIQQSLCYSGTLTQFHPLKSTVSPHFLPYPLLLSNLFGSNISVLPFVSLLLFLQTLHYTIVPYVCAAHKEVSLESADANYKFNLHFN